MWLFSIQKYNDIEHVFIFYQICDMRLRCLGFGMDLVCLAEQPLHAVPLLKFHKKQPRFRDQHTPIYEYAIPQWINHSFYRSPQQRNSTSRFIPRMKLPERPIVIDEETGIPEGVFYVDLKYPESCKLLLNRVNAFVNFSIISLFLDQLLLVLSNKSLGITRIF